ncbi:MAG: DUF2877 domain-containing protein, partial [Candidatus Dormibacteraeota bacterium]|nr:DUF2877 domain-containing protein [Candidatus Dormibacteraeota bacterium]
TGRMLGAGRASAYVMVDSFVIALTTASVPLLPNAVRLAALEADLAGAAHGSRVRLGPGLIQGEGFSVRWDPQHPPLWEPRLSGSSPENRLKVLIRAQALSELSGAIDLELLAAEAVPAAARLWRAIADDDGTSAAQAARELIGRGPGLTPEGDDLVAGTVATLLAWAPALGWSTPPPWFRRILPGDLRRRTTAISATLLELALDGCVAEPLARVLDLGSSDDRWRARWGELLRLGHSTGRALALAAARTGTALCAASAPGHGACDEATVSGA